MTVVILRALVPTVIATTFFELKPAGAEAFEDFEAAEEIDAGPLRLSRRSVSAPDQPNRLSDFGLDPTDGSVKSRPCPAIGQEHLGGRGLAVGPYVARTREETRSDQEDPRCRPIWTSMTSPE